MAERTIEWTGQSGLMLPLLAAYSFLASKIGVRGFEPPTT